MAAGEASGSVFGASVFLSLSLSPFLFLPLFACGFSNEQKMADDRGALVSKALVTLDKMKSEGLVTPEQHAAMRAVLMKRLEKGIPSSEGEVDSIYNYVSTRYDNLRNLRLLQQKKSITPQEYERMRENVLDLPK
jgi:hypothetical protein